MNSGAEDSRRADLVVLAPLSPWPPAADLDAWLASKDATRRAETGHFVRIPT